MIEGEREDFRTVQEEDKKIKKQQRQQLEILSELNGTLITSHR